MEEIEKKVDEKLAKELEERAINRIVSLTKQKELLLSQEIEIEEKIQKIKENPKDFFLKEDTECSKQTQQTYRITANQF